MDIVIDYKSAIPVYEQIKQCFKMEIISGKYKEGDQTPSVRELSTKLKVSQNTVLKSYFQLDQEGFLESKPGKGYFVCQKNENQNVESDKLFQMAVDDLINRMGDLGYNLDDIISAMNKIKGRMSNK